MQRQQNQIDSLQTQLDKVDEELEQLTSVYFPYRGKIRRVKILGQNEGRITAEVTQGYSRWEIGAIAFHSRLLMLRLRGLINR